MGQSRFLRKPDALDRTIMNRLACRVGPNDPVVMMYDLGELSSITEGDLQPLALLLFQLPIAPPNHQLIIQSKQTSRYILQVKDPQILVPSLMIDGEHRRLRSVHFTDLHGNSHTVEMPVLPDPAA